MRLIFRGRILGVGSTSGVRIVVGRWSESPLGSFTDAMVETREGHRVLLAPSAAVADFVQQTYTFDEVRIEPITAEATGGRWQIAAPSLSLDVRVGNRTRLGQLIRLVPRRLAVHPLWCALIDPIARTVLDGVRTRGSAGNGRREWYGATDVASVDALAGTFDAVDLGTLAPVDPPCRFGFSSTPIAPSATTVVTTIDVPQGAPA